LTTLPNGVIITLYNQEDYPMTQNSQLLDIISDPITGPFEGEDFCVDEQGHIQVYDSNPKVAAMIMRKANMSGLFPVNLVKVAHKGDAIILGFDTVSGTEPVFVNQIGYQRGVLVEVRVGDDGKFCVYLDRRRSARTFAKLASAKTFIKRLDKDLQTVGNTVATYEESDD
jgi:hypothetical protein